MIASFSHPFKPSSGVLIWDTVYSSVRLNVSSGLLVRLPLEGISFGGVVGTGVGATQEGAWA